MKLRFPSFTPRHFYLRVYIAVLLALFVGAVLYYGASYLLARAAVNKQHSAFNTFAQLASRAVPTIDTPIAEQQQLILELHYSLGTHFALFSDKGTLIANSKAGFPAPDLRQKNSGWMAQYPTVFALKLADGRWLLGQEKTEYQVLTRQAIIIILTCLMTAAGLYPVVRRMTKRLEDLQHHVKALGEGQLQARVDVTGSDEIAELASNFNNSAERIEALVRAQKNLLANASHELRSPLARIRMAVELLVENRVSFKERHQMRDELARNIAELDQLIDEILLASRLDAGYHLVDSNEQVDLQAILQDECNRLHIPVSLPACHLAGDAKLLRRMVRNLLENAQRYGNETQVDLTVDEDMQQISITISDRGPGIPEPERERIFEPFYRLPGSRERDGGVGLGLALVKQIAQRHAGKVTCHGRQGGGSQFIVVLPHKPSVQPVNLDQVP